MMTKPLNIGAEPPPVLRSPPFPAVAVATAAISAIGAAHPPRESLTRQEGERARLIIAAIKAARVGGSFWGAQSAVRDAAAGDIDPWYAIDQCVSFSAEGDDETGLLAWVAGVPVDWTSPGRFERFVADGAPDPLERAVTTCMIDAIEYRDPYSGRPVTIETAIAQLAIWRRAIDANRGLSIACGIALWKRREVEAMLWPGHAIHFERQAESAVARARRDGSAVVVWPTRSPVGLVDAAAAAGVPLWRVEDGFLRSTGLGSECHPPHSIVLDRQGLHFDPSRPSDLEDLIAQPITDTALLNRAHQLVRTIIEGGISKYAVGGASYERPAQAQRLVLVVGQVEGDLSVRLGGAGITTNLELIRRARAAEPDAFLLFKPHPDVDRGHRVGRVADADALAYVDRVVRDTPMASMLEVVDAVHVLTSLSGFEALIRGCEVIVHGQPFYAGWGLTRDLAPPIQRRGGRTVSKDALVAATLILYPRYVDPVTRLPCTPELLVERLAAQPRPQENLLTRFRRIQGKMRRGLGRLGVAA